MSRAVSGRAALSARAVRVLCVKANGVPVRFKEYSQDQLGQAQINAAARLSFGIEAFIDTGAVEQFPEDTWLANS